MTTMYNLWSGGTRPGNASFGMLPSADASYATVGFADHQRRRSYQVTRQMRFLPRVPYGGAYAYADQKDWEWYTNTLIAGGGNVAASDVWKLIIIPPYCRVEYLAIQVFGGVATLDFTLMLVDTTGSQVGSLGQITTNGAAAKVPTSVLVPAADQNTGATPIYVAAVFTAVPSTAGILKLQGLDFACQAEVVDWGSLDLNANA